MRIQNLVVTLAISFVSGLSFNITINQGAVAQTAEQIRQLTNKGVPVVLPDYLPLGFQSIGFEAHLSDDGNSYIQEYKGLNNCSIQILGADFGGWGAPEPIRQWEVNTPLFGKIILEEWDRSDETPPRPNYLDFSGSIKDFPQAKAIYWFTFECEGSVFSVQEASQILKSMEIVE